MAVELGGGSFYKSNVGPNDADSILSDIGHRRVGKGFSIENGFILLIQCKMNFMRSNGSKKIRRT
jgi:hypothetical protein